MTASLRKLHSISRRDKWSVETTPVTSDAAIVRLLVCKRAQSYQERIQQRLAESTDKLLNSRAAICEAQTCMDRTIECLFQSWQRMSINPDKRKMFRSMHHLVHKGQELCCKGLNSEAQRCFEKALFLLETEEGIRFTSTLSNLLAKVMRQAGCHVEGKVLSERSLDRALGRNKPGMGRPGGSAGFWELLGGE